jgi:hypothetical protein
MFTTALLIRSATSAKFTTVGTPVNADARRVSPAGASARGAAVETIGAGVNSPAMMRPTRNATMAESATVRAVNRLDI